MTRLKAALDPRSVAIIGASENPNKVGGRPVHYLDKFGFKGKIFPINPSRPKCRATNATRASAISRRRLIWRSWRSPAITPSAPWKIAPRMASRSRS